MDGIEKLLTVAETCEILQLTPRAVNEMVRAGKLGCVQLTRKKRLFTEEQIRSYIDSQTITPKMVDQKPSDPLPSKAKGGERKRDQRVTRVSEPVSVREEIRRLCQ